jgi:hypothetical protein
MNLTRRHILCGGAALAVGCVAGREGEPVLYRDDFDSGLDQWRVEAEVPGRIASAGGLLDIDVPAGATVWFRPVLEGPVAIDYDAVAVAEGGPNDAVSDLNCFWMATDTRAPGGDVLARPRSGAFAEYDELRTYYAGIGGNRNTTTRFRRYVGERDNRPLLPEHDLAAPEHLLAANRWTRIRLIAAGRRIALLRDGSPLFELDDPAPYTRGRFGLRTTKSHLRVANFRVRRLTGG